VTVFISKISLTIHIPYALEPVCYCSEYLMGRSARPKNQYGFGKLFGLACEHNGEILGRSLFQCTLSELAALTKSNKISNVERFNRQKYYLFN